MSLLGNQGLIARPPRLIRPAQGIALRASGGANAIAVAAGLPELANLAYHYDFTDITQLFQTIDETSPVTADAQSIGRCNDKGTAGVPITTGGTDSRKPTYNTGDATGVGQATFDGSDMLYHIAATSGLDTGAYSSFIIGRYQSGSQQYSASYGLHDLSFRWVANGGWTLGMSSGEHTAQPAQTDDTVTACIAVDTGSNVQTGYYSDNATTSSKTSTTAGPDNGDECVIGDLFGPSAFPIAPLHTASAVFEWAIWDKELDATAIAAIQAYTASKYGLTWAA